MSKTFAAAVFSFVLLAPAPAPADDAPLSLSVEAWLLAATRAWQPAYSIPATFVQGVQIVPGESLEAHAARRAQIVADVWAVVRDPKSPKIFKGPVSAQATALFVLAIFHEESHYDLRVDKHHCAGLGKNSCDGGAAYCMGQIHPKDLPQLGLSGSELEADRKKCVLAVITRLAAARAGAPKALPPSADVGDLFCGYAVGSYQSPCPSMRVRWFRVSSWVKSHPVPTAPPA
jgi:hypothetical protein